VPGGSKSLGDVLVVAVNADAGIQRLKGRDRPINTLDDRLHVLAALSCIDYLIAFDEDTPCDLVRTLRPEIFVKGGDYTRERLPQLSTAPGGRLGHVGDGQGTVPQAGPGCCWIRHRI
jgi:D-beta-D-heptose 7-phosphate kinase / D-beta-D-heptose 1-phosphate adenosyltransferase